MPLFVIAANCNNCLILHSISAMRKSLLFVLMLVSLLSTKLHAQQPRTIKDSCLNVFMFGFALEGDITAGDLKYRFGPGITVGGVLSYKTSNNWIFSLEYAYMYSANVRENHALDSISTKNADPTQRYIINGNGEYQILNIYESGNIALFKVGKILPIFQRNPNCGVSIKVGGGFMEHKIYYYWVGDAPPQLSGNYINGYDRLTYGPAISQALGYHYMSNNARINFDFDFEAIEGFTYNQRPYDFDLMRQETKRRTDVLLGFKFAWIFPIYGKNSRVGGTTFY